MFGRLGPMELILVLAIALVIFGPKKLPEIGRALGSAIRNFKKGTSKLTEDLDTDLDESENTATAKTAAKVEKNERQGSGSADEGKGKNDA